MTYSNVFGYLSVYSSIEGKALAFRLTSEMIAVLMQILDQESI